MTTYQGRELLSIREATVRAGVSRRTIYNWLEAGKVETIRTVGGRRGSPRIFADTLFRQAPPVWRGAPA